MSEKIRKSLPKFNTIALTERTTRKGQFRSSQKKNTNSFLNPQSLNTTINFPNNISLPKIGEKKRKKKYGTFMESWLDQALGEADPYATQEESKKNNSIDNAGVLKTLKRFQLDKQYLQSLNIPGERIQRLYQTLYIYSHGVEKIFKELIQFSKEFDNPDILGNFWRAYSKLLQGCTSYHTVFQKVEKDHIQNIVGLKHNLQERATQFEEEKKQLSEKMGKLQKALQEKQNKFKQLQEQYEVMSATLGLTDEAFNEEVNLRLKFQEKINSVYTSYQELKLKYTKIVEEMHVRKQEIMIMESKQNVLKNQVLVEKVKVDELRQRLDKEVEKVREREVEIDIKRQQLEDIKQIFQAKMNKETEAGDIVEQQIAKYKALNVKLIQSNNIIAGLRLSLKTKEQQIEKITQNLQEMKKKNNKIYQDNIEYGRTIVKLQSDILARNLVISNQQNKIQTLHQQNKTLATQLTQMTQIKEKFDKDNQILNKTLIANQDTRDKNQKLIQNLKAAKDKYERINQMLNENIGELTNMLSKKSIILNESMGEVQSLKMLIDARTKSMTMMDKQIEQERETYKVKAEALNALIAKKQSIVSEAQKQMDDFRNKLSEMENEHRKLQETIINKDSQIMKLQVSLSAKTKQVKDYENQVKETEVRYQELAKSLEKNLHQKRNTAQKLLSTEFVLKKRKDEENLTIINLKKLLEEYKQILEYKAQFVHPMVYEQARTITIEAEHRQHLHRINFDKISKRNKEVEGQYRELQDKYNQLLDRYEKLVESHNLVLKKGDDLVREVAGQKTENQNKQKKIKLMQADLEKKKSEIKEKETQVRELEVVNVSIKEQMATKQIFHGQLKIKIEELTSKNKQLQKNELELDKIKKTIKKIPDSNKVNAEIQTQDVNIKSLGTHVSEKGEIKYFEQAGIQTDQYETGDDRLESELVAKYQTPYKHEDSGDLSSSASPGKKIQKREFKKALKFTYMRR